MPAKKMRLARLSLIAFFLSFALTANGQEAPQATLVDEFGALPCDNLLGRVDAFAAELHSNPESTAFILVRPPSVRPELAQSRRRFISARLQLQGITTERFSFYRQQPELEMNTQFWRIPAGADRPRVEATVWSAPEPDVSRPFVFGNSDEIVICPTFVPKAFAKLILDNPGSRGNIVITSEKKSMANKYYFASGWIRTLVEVHGVPRNRLRLFFTKGDETGAEFWFVPARKK